MVYTDTLIDLRRQYAEQEINQEEYLDLLVSEIRYSDGFEALMACVYENLFDEEYSLNLVSSFTDEQLHNALNELKTGCVARQNETLPAHLSLLEELLDQEGFGILVRWGLSRLVGMAVKLHEAKNQE